MKNRLSETVREYIDQCEIVATEPAGDRVRVTLRYKDQDLVIPVAVVTKGEVITTAKAVSAAWHMAGIARHYPTEFSFFRRFIHEWGQLSDKDREKKEADMRPMYEIWLPAGTEAVRVFGDPFGFLLSELEQMK